MASLNAFDMFQPTLTINTPTMALDILNHEDFDDFDCKVMQIFIREKSTLFILVTRLHDFGRRSRDTRTRKSFQ